MAVDGVPRPQWQMFPPPRLPVFTSGDDGCHLDHFTTEARRVISHFNMAALGGEGAEWLIQSLAGAARKEVNLHPPQATATADLVLTILQDTFGDHASSSSLLSSFYSISQSQEEGILSYAHKLQALQVKTNAVVAGTVTDAALREQFMHGLFLPAMRRDLMRFARGREAVTFAAVRAEALRWMREDFEVVTKQQQATESSTEVRSLQLQVSELAVKSAELRAALHQHTPAASRQQKPSAKPRCWLCNRHGHLQSRCPTKRQRDQQPLSWRQPSEKRVSQSTSITQPLREQSCQTEEEHQNVTLPVPVQLHDTQQVTFWDSMLNLAPLPQVPATPTFPDRGTVCIARPVFPPPVQPHPVQPAAPAPVLQAQVLPVPVLRVQDQPLARDPEPLVPPPAAVPVRRSQRIRQRLSSF
ncbi:uncharacterized protein [Littorina saxatilis]|uniref:uncharacterized protein n=1 Tax=Littorina saxatilis TaxID=31220 RepID=UPI0038B5C206